MSNNVIQTSFAGGELSPTLYARVDLAKYHIGAALLSNFFVDYRGGASTRTGTEYVTRARYSDRATRLIPFQFSTIQSYILEFGDLYMRVIVDGGVVLETAKTVAGITQANPGVVNVVAHGFSTDDEVSFTVVGMAQLNIKNYNVQVVDADHFQLQELGAGINLNTAGYGAFVSGTVARVYTVVSPYGAADLALLKWTQSADVLTLVHTAYPAYELIRTSVTSWSFNLIAIGATISPPTSIVALASGAGTASYSYVITAVDTNGVESVASARTDITAAVDIGATAGNIALSWNAVADAASYNVYKAVPASDGALSAYTIPYGYMTTTYNAGLSATDNNIVADFTYTPPLHTDPFGTTNYPGAVAYYQQRLTFAGSAASPETFWMSRPGQFHNFDVSDPVISSDAITGTLVSRQVNNIKYMIGMPGGLIMLTGGGAWQVSGGGANAAVTPTSIVATPQAYNGCADVEPIVINYDILYVQQKGTVVRDLSYNFYTNIYTGADLSVLSNHLFTGFTIKEWAYAEEPFKLIWCVRSDGALLSLTYLKEQEVFGWAQHSTQGRFKSIATIQEGQENAVYCVVERMIGGAVMALIERFHSRLMTFGAEDAWAVDCGLTSTLPTPAATLTIAASSGDDVLFTSDAAIFSSGSVGSVIRAGGGIATITSFVDANNVHCSVTRAITDVDMFRSPEVVWPQLPGAWSLTAPFTTMAGLDHIEGETVAILGDGNVFPSQVVTSGRITLSEPCSKVTAGLGFTAKLQSLRLDTGEPSIQGKRKFIPAVTVRVDQARGLKMGPTFNDLTEYKDRDLDTIGQAIELHSGDQRIQMEQSWNTEGQICVQQDYPLPATILGLIPEVQIGDTGK